MIQRISKRFLSLLLVAVMVLALVPAITLPAFAATNGAVTGLSDANIGLSFDGTAEDAWNANGSTRSFRPIFHQKQQNRKSHTVV